MTVTVHEIAAWVDGRVDGDGNQPISGAAALTDARAGDITFLEQDRYLSAFESSAAAAAIAGEGLPAGSRPLIRVKDPLTAFIQIIQRMHPKPVIEYTGIHPRACIEPTAVVSADAFVGPGAVVGPGTVVGPRCRIHAGAVVGARCKLKGDVTLHPNVVLYDDCDIGSRVTIHSNAVIGADGFGYRTIGGRHVKVPQIGIVEIQDDVEIGAGTTIDRATFGRTVIGQGTKIDNLVMIGHNCRIGRHNVIVSQVGIAGSCSTGDYVVMGGQVGIADHCHIGDRTMLGGKCGVVKDVPPDMRMHGVPAVADRDAIRIALSLEKLPELQRQVKRIRKLLDLKGE